jgi:glutaminyl-tRNA synthetase
LNLTQTTAIRGVDKSPEMLFPTGAMSNQNVNPSEGVPAPEQLDFIREIVRQHLAEAKYKKIVTRFPPEPNGYLHIGHAKSICLNFGIAREFNGQCNLRMDDTNPTKEDVKWLIAGWADHCLGMKPKGKTPETITSNGKKDFHLPAVVQSAVRNPQSAIPLEPFYASDYFDQIYEWAIELIKKGKAYVCDHTAEEVDRMRGAPDKDGESSEFRNRSIEESLDLFVRMKNGEFPDGNRTLRAKIDMASSNVWMRDPILYRIRHSEHHHTGAKWCIYPMYDFAHCLSDYIEGITHSICTLEFEVHRPLYDWILENLDLPRPLPHQYEFARLNVTYTVMSKRKLLRLVEEGKVRGWDDPRMPTISGMRRRGYPAEALRAFCERIGVAKRENVIEFGLLEHFVRENLNKRALRRLAVLRPIKVVITNLPESHFEELDAVNNPENPATSTRKIPFSRTLYIEQDDFMEVPPPKFHRLKPGGEVRLKYAYIIKCDEVIKDADGKITELRCTADLGSKTSGPTSSRKIKGTIHWVSAAHAIDAEVRLYKTLFTVPEPDAAEDFRTMLNPDSLEVITAKVEPTLKGAETDLPYQFERLGYFAFDPDTKSGKPVLNRTITLKDTWAKIEKRATNEPSRSKS